MDDTLFFRGGLSVAAVGHRDGEQHPGKLPDGARQIQPGHPDSGLSRREQGVPTIRQYISGRQYNLEALRCGQSFVRDFHAGLASLLQGKLPVKW
jgi:hypothetical protein